MFEDIDYTLSEIQKLKDDCDITVNHLTTLSAARDYLNTTAEPNINVVIDILKPSFNYDQDEVLSIIGSETITVENAQANAANFFTNIDALIMKIFRVFYNLFKKLQQKVVLFFNNIEKTGKQVKEKLDAGDIKSDFTEEDKLKIVNYIGAFGVQSQSINDNTFATILVTVKKLNSFSKILSTYGKSLEEMFEKSKVTYAYGRVRVEATKVLLNSGFKSFDSISEGVTSSLSNGYITGNHRENQKTLVTGISGDKLSTITVGTVLPDVGFKNVNYTVNVSKAVKTVSLTPQTKDNVTKLLNATLAVDVKQLINDTTSDYKVLEINTNKLTKKISDLIKSPKEGKEEELKLHSAWVKEFISYNIGVFNTATFDNINSNVRLLSNLVRFVALHIDDKK